MKGDDAVKDLKTPNIGREVRIGILICLTFFGTFVLWSTLVRLETGAIAGGKLIAGSTRKTIQHLEGGIIDKILVKEGQEVRRGDLLIQLASGKDLENYEELKLRSWALAVLEARLIAERDDKKRITWPAKIKLIQDFPEVSRMLRVQKEIFINNRAVYKERVTILRERVEQLKMQMSSTRAKMAAEKRQLKLVQEERDTVQELLEEQLVRRPRYLALEREIARLEARHASQIESIQRAEQSIKEIGLQFRYLTKNRLKATLDELEEVQQQAVEHRHKLRAREEVLERKRIVAPVAGRVFHMKYETVGGVIPPRAPILELVPANDPFIVEAYINPLDVDVVHRGLKAKVNITALGRREQKPIEAVVSHISADIVKDEAGGAPHYVVHLEIDESTTAHLSQQALYPGMPVQVLIVSDIQTPLQYLLGPVKQSFSRAFREG